MHKCNILFFPQHIPRFIAASYKEEQINIDKKFKLSGNTYFYQICKSLRKEYHMQIQPFQKQKKKPLKLFLASR